jgi:hypothetical protein
MDDFLVTDECEYAYPYQPQMMPPPMPPPLPPSCPSPRPQLSPITPTSYSVPTREPELANPGRR